MEYNTDGFVWEKSSQTAHAVKRDRKPDTTDQVASVELTNEIEKLSQEDFHDWWEQQQIHEPQAHSKSDANASAHNTPATKRGAQAATTQAHQHANAQEQKTRHKMSKSANGSNDVTPAVGSRTKEPASRRRLSSNVMPTQDVHVTQHRPAGGDMDKDVFDTVHDNVDAFSSPVTPKAGAAHASDVDAQHFGSDAISQDALHNSEHHVDSSLQTQQQPNQQAERYAGKRKQDDISEVDIVDRQRELQKHSNLVKRNKKAREYIFSLKEKCDEEKEVINRKLELLLQHHGKMFPEEAAATREAIDKLEKRKSQLDNTIQNYTSDVCSFDALLKQINVSCE